LPHIDFPQLRDLTQNPDRLGGALRDRQQISDRPAAEGDLKQIADEIVLHRYAPAGLIVNADLEILEFRGNTTPYLQPALCAYGKPYVWRVAGARFEIIDPIDLISSQVPWI
jgi:hypothetical protein